MVKRHYFLDPMRQFVKHSNHLASLLLGLAVLTGCVGTQTHSPVAVSTDKARVIAPDPAAQARVVETYGQLPLRFEANQGQTDPQVKFLSRGRGYTLFLTPSEAVMALRQPQGKPSTPGRVASRKRARPGGSFRTALRASRRPPWERSCAIRRSTRPLPTRS